MTTRKIQCNEPGCNEFVRNLIGRCPKHLNHECDWIGKLEPLDSTPDFASMVDALVEWALGHLSRDSFPFKYTDESILPQPCKDRLGRLDGYVRTVMFETVGKVPDATTLYNDLINPMAISSNPLSTASGIVSFIQKNVESSFPKNEYASEVVQLGIDGRIHEVPVRIVSSLLGLAFICEETNRGTLFRTLNGLKGVDSLGAIMTFTTSYCPIRYTNMTRNDVIGLSRRFQNKR